MQKQNGRATPAARPPTERRQAAVRRSSEARLDEEAERRVALSAHVHPGERDLIPVTSTLMTFMAIAGIVGRPETDETS
jgi:hypothetical protein